MSETNPPVFGQWQPMETAPKDGTPIVGFDGDDVRICSWEPLDTPMSRHWGFAGTWCRRPIRGGKSLIYSTFVPVMWVPAPPATPEVQS